MSSLSPPSASARPSIAARLGGLVRTLFGRQSRAAVIGHVDELRDGVLYGWAFEPDAPDRRLCVDVLIGGRFVGQTRAYLFRQDLQDAGYGDGAYGFELLVGDGLPADLVGVRAFALGERRIELVSPGSGREDRAIDGVDDYLRATFSGLVSNSGPSVPELPAASHEAGRWAALFRPAAADGPSAYVRQIARRDCFESSDPVKELLDYVTRYGRRRGLIRAPLSGADIAALTEAQSDGSKAGRAQQALSRAGADDAFEAAWSWAIHEAATWAVEDCLVPEPQLDALRTVDVVQEEPLSRSMQQFMSLVPFLAALDLQDAGNRRRVWLWLLLMSVAMPHVLRTLPRDGLARFVTPDETGRTRFDETLAQVFGPTVYSAARWRADIAREGYDLKRGAFSSVAPTGDRIWSAAQPVQASARVDVQLIGPFSRRLGISDSCRSLAAALQSGGRSLRLCDYTLDHPNAQRDCTDLPLEAPGPARVTILHLKLEDAPTALAYLPDVFSETRLIVFPYLESPEIGPAHRLGLELADETWAASGFIAEALSPHAPTFRVGTACKPLRSFGRAAARTQAYGGLVGDGDFIVLTAGDAFSGVKRKNPLGAISAFREAFPADEGARLVIKTHSRNQVEAQAERETWSAVLAAAQEDPRILLLDRLVSDDEMAALLEGADCLLSLHRAEGFGYHMLEAMKLGTPVVATAWSGNLDFCTPETAFLVDFAQTPILPGDYGATSPGQTWAEPDQASAVAALRRVRLDPEEGARKAAAARKLADRDFSIAALAARVDRRLSDLLPSVPFRD